MRNPMPVKQIAGDDGHSMRWEISWRCPDAYVRLFTKEVLQDLKNELRPHSLYEITTDEQFASAFVRLIVEEGTMGFYYILNGIAERHSLDEKKLAEFKRWFNKLPLYEQTIFPIILSGLACGKGVIEYYEEDCNAGS